MTKHISLALASLRLTGCGIPEYHFTDLTPFDGVFEGSESFALDVEGVPDKPTFGQCTGDIVVDVQVDATPQVLGQGSCTVEPGCGWSYVLSAETTRGGFIEGEITLTDGEVTYTLPIEGEFEDESLRATFGGITLAGVDGSIVNVKGGFVATRD